MWANRFKVEQLGRTTALILYERELREKLAVGHVGEREVLSLGGRRLACWCHPEPCHGDVLVRVWWELTEASSVEGCCG